MLCLYQPDVAHLGHRLTWHFRGLKHSPSQDLTAGWGTTGRKWFAGPSPFPGLLSCRVALGKSFFHLG